MTTPPVRPAAAGDAPGIAALLRAAFGREAESALVAALRAEGAVAIELVAATAASPVLGHLLFSRMSVDGVAALALAPLAVAPTARRLGLGGRLVRHGLALAASGPEGWCLVLGDPSYYRRFGFRPAAAGRVTGVPWAGHPAF